MSPVNIQIHILRDDKHICFPTKGTKGSVGYDLVACQKNHHKVIEIEPMERILVPTGISIVLPEGYEGQIRSRSGISYKQGIVVLNAPGTIDWDYSGEIFVALINFSDVKYTISYGDRIAQLVIMNVPNVNLFQAGGTPINLTNTSYRGAKGFGSTG